ncbi:MAG: DMT family transporter [Hyphomicrobiaceae bacterium]|nr:MAG: DMT family transporter [Hyphomicrobiaceae bacterium]
MRTTDWLLLIALSVLWGATFFFVAVAVKDIPPFTLVLVRVSLAAVILLPLALLIGHRLPPTFAAWRRYVVLAVLNNVLPFSVMFYGQTLIASSLASVLNATTPLFTLLVARVFANEPLTMSKLAGVLLGIAGVAILMGPAALDADLTHLVGAGCLLLAAFSYGLSALWLRQLRDSPPLLSAGVQLFCSSLLLLPIAGTFDRFWTLPPPSLPAIAAAVGLALFSTALAYVLFFRIIASAGATNVMLVTLMVPVTATALGAVFLGEALTVNQIAGALVIASGLAVIDGRLPARLFGRR